MTIKAKKPFFTWPLARIVEVIGPIADGIRSLPDAQFADEFGQLQQMCTGQGASLAEGMMLRIFEAEKARRDDPAMQFDDALDLALERLERATNEADRQLVQDIGRKLFSIGGKPAMEAAYRRMINRARPTRRGPRTKVLAKRWAGIAGASRRPVTEEDIDAAQSRSGGYSRAALAQWGVPWPPPPGWKRQLIELGAPYQQDETKRTAA